MRGWLLNIFESLHKKRAVPLRTFLPFFFVTLFGFAFFLVPHFTFASWWNPADWVKDFLSVFLMAIASTIYLFGFFLVKLGVWYNSFLMSTSAVTENWGIMRNLALTTFGLIIIVIAVMNILKVKIDEWGVSRMIPRVALASFLVIISRYACLSLMNFANALSNIVTTSLKLSLWEPFTLLGDVMKETCTNCGSDGRLIAALMTLVIAVVSFAFLAVLAIVLFIRALFLVFLLVVSPIAFALMVLPWTNKVFTKWWDMFIKWTFFYPMALAILAVGVKLSMGAHDAQLPGLEAVIANTIPAEVALFTTDIKPLLIQFSFSLIALITIPLAIFMPLSLLGGAGSAIRKGIGYAGGMASGKHHIPGLKYDPKALRETVNAYRGEASKRKISAMGAKVRPFTNKDPFRKNRFTSPYSAIGRNLEKSALAERSKAIETLGIDKKMGGFFARRDAAIAKGGSTRVVDKEMKDHIDKIDALDPNRGALLRTQIKDHDDFVELHGEENTALAVAGDAASRGWLGKAELDDPNLNSIANERGYNLVSAPKQAAKWLNRTGKPFNTCNPSDLGKMADEAISGSKEAGWTDADLRAHFNTPEGESLAIAIGMAKESEMSIGKKKKLAERLELIGINPAPLKIVKDAARGAAYTPSSGGGPTTPPPTPGGGTP